MQSRMTKDTQMLGIHPACPEDACQQCRLAGCGALSSSTQLDPDCLFCESEVMSLNASSKSLCQSVKAHELSVWLSKELGVGRFSAIDVCSLQPSLHVAANKTSASLGFVQQQEVAVQAVSSCLLCKLMGMQSANCTTYVLRLARHKERTAEPPTT